MNAPAHPDRPIRDRQQRAARAVNCVQQFDSLVIFPNPRLSHDMLNNAASLISTILSSKTINKERGSKEIKCHGLHYVRGLFKDRLLVIAMSLLTG